MKVLLISIGTRGDVEPFLAVGKQLQENGHEVHTAFPAQYAYLAEETGLVCHPLDPAFIELIEGDSAKEIMGGKLGPIKKIRAYYKMYKASTQVNRSIFKEQHTLIQDLNPDRVVYSGKAVYPIAWSKTHMDKTILLSPVPCLIHPVKHLPHLGFHNSLGVLNGLTYKLANWGLVTAIHSVSKILPETKGISKRELNSLVKQNKMVYAISEELFPRPDYWPAHVKVMGYQERPKQSVYAPDKRLLDFISLHEKILLVSFGSMENPSPKVKTNIILKELEKQGIPAIINCAEGGLEEPAEYNTSQFYFVSRIPYDWIFPQVYAVMHHGGSGTTHLAVKYGCSSLIIPHIIDQFLWNNIIHQKGLGPKGVSIQKISASRLTPLLSDLWTNDNYKRNAEVAGERMRKENHSERLIQFIVI